VTLDISGSPVMIPFADNAIPGYPMAVNLRNTMVINDVNDAATQKFVEEVGNVTIAKTVREVAEQTVRRYPSGLSVPLPLHPLS
jgi:CheY-specific phosphatase CheX